MFIISLVLILLVYSRGSNNNQNKKWANLNNSRSNHASSSPALTHEAIVQDPTIAKQMHDRMLYLLGNLTVI